MAARTENQNMLSATLAMSATLPATYDASGYGATGVVFTAVGKVEDFGEHGIERGMSSFTPVDTGIVEKFNGSKNFGAMAVMLGNVPVNAGQVIAKAASEATAHYSVKVTYPTGPGESTGEIHYLDVIVTRYKFQDGATDAVRKASMTLEICRAPVIVAAT